MIMREADFQAALLRALNAPNSGLRVWRQNAGRLVTNRGTLQGAPKGAGDLCGFVEPEGWHIEIECKGPRTAVKKHQVAWGRMLKRKGAIYVLVRSKAQLSLEENVRLAEGLVRAAIERKRADFDQARDQGDDW